MATSSTNFVAALGTGSGIDIKALAKNLVDAERQPKVDLIQKTIDKSKARITGYTATQFAITELTKAVDALKNVSDFNNFKLSSTQSSALSVTSSGLSSVGTFDIAVSQLALGQRTVSNSFASGQSLNGGASFDITIQVGSGTASTVTVDTPTPEGVVSAINAAGLSVSASLVNNGDASTPMQIVLNGPSGSTNGFTVSDTSSTALGFVTPVTAATAVSPNRAAQDAILTVDGIPMTRSSNQVSDAITGVTLNLLSTTSGTAQISSTRDTAPIKEKIKQIVTAYNDLQAILDAALDKESEIENLGGTLAGDATIRNLRSQVREIVMPTTSSSSTGISHLRDLGIFIDVDDKMKFSTLVDATATVAAQRRVGDESTLDAALASNFDDVLSLFAGTSGDGIAKTMSDQLSGSGVYVDSVASPSSPKKLLAALTQGASQRITSANDRMADLERRMEMLLERYTRQFSIMDSLVGESRSLRTSVENSFKGMSASR